MSKNSFDFTKKEEKNPDEENTKSSEEKMENKNKKLDETNVCRTSGLFFTTDKWGLEGEGMGRQSVGFYREKSEK